MFNWQEDFQGLLRDGIQGFAEASWGFIQDAFSASDLDDHWWASVVGGEIETVVNGEVVSTITHPGMLNVVVVALIPLLLIFIAIQVILSMIRGSVAGLMRAMAMAVFALPATYIVTGLVWLVVTGVDEVSLWILQTGTEGGTDEAMAGLLALFGMTWDSNTQEVLLDENYMQWQWAVQDGEFGRSMVSFVVGLIIWLACLVLILMMVFRLVAILILTVFMPAAIFAVSFEGSKAIFSRWAGVMLGLILAKPMAAVVIKLGLVMSSLGGNWIEAAIGIVIILVAAAMPLVLAPIFAAVTGGGSTSVDQAGAGMGRSGGGRLERGASRTGRSIGRNAKNMVSPRR
ncbi:MAG: hypothetical protein HLX51_01820 [Micrococcaceae bacterium]|nr:hypothetical protein [Micrococcaceae bacterium]